MSTSKKKKPIKILVIVSAIIVAVGVFVGIYTKSLIFEETEETTTLSPIPEETEEPTTFSPQEIELIDKNAKKISEAMNLPIKNVMDVSEKLVYVGAEEIETITVVEKDEYVWSIEIIDMKKEKYCLNLNKYGGLGVICKNDFGSKGEFLFAYIDD